ncbi:hypothetical protein VIGAN_11110600, partial [Vigna angularis var. angularis]
FTTTHPRNFPTHTLPKSDSTRSCHVAILNSKCHPTTCCQLITLATLDFPCQHLQPPIIHQLKPYLPPLSGHHAPP